jgi:hypothetical protein
MGIDLNRTFSKEEVQMLEKYMEKKPHHPWP